MASEKGTIDTNDLQSAVLSVSKLSGNRILPYYEEIKEGELTKIKIPVSSKNISDRTDRAMRGYLSDWIKRNIKDVGVDTRFETMPGGTAYYAEEKEFPIIGCITVTWWPKKPESDFDKLRREKYEKLKRLKATL